MSTETQQTAPESVDTARTLAPSALLTSFMQRMLRKIDCGEILLQTPGGRRFLIKGKRAGERAHVVLHRWKCMLRLLTSGDLGFAEGYLAGEWSTPNIYSFLRAAGRSSNDAASFEGLRPPQPITKFRHAMNRNTRRGSRRNIAAHYDLGNDFYQLVARFQHVVFVRDLFVAGPNPRGRTARQTRSRDRSAWAGRWRTGAGNRLRLGRACRAHHRANRLPCNGIDVIYPATRLCTTRAVPARFGGSIRSPAAGLSRRRRAPTIGSCRSRCWKPSARPIGRPSLKISGRG